MDLQDQSKENVDLESVRAIIDDYSDDLDQHFGPPDIIRPKGHGPALAVGINSSSSTRPKSVGSTNRWNHHFFFPSLPFMSADLHQILLILYPPYVIVLSAVFQSPSSVLGCRFPKAHFNKTKARKSGGEASADNGHCMVKEMPFVIPFLDGEKATIKRETQENGAWRRSNLELYHSYKESDIINFIKVQRIKWAGPVVRMDEDHSTKKIFNAQLIGTRRKDRSNLRWIDDLVKYLLVLGTKFREH
ncbi:uncharacterized protein TNCV_1794721 [Trichonephila clavipes]|nr:uncharacterized protein TNCV_1794721 [Trichonephila clavipes]